MLFLTLNVGELLFGCFCLIGWFGFMFVVFDFSLSNHLFMGHTGELMYKHIEIFSQRNVISGEFQSSAL